jgi:hypothetical protein
MADPDPSLRRTWIGVIVVETIVVLTLWLVGRYFA